MKKDLLIKFIRAMSKPVSRRTSKADAKHWNDILANAKAFPELALTAQSLIKTLLGFVPPEYITLPHEPFLRALLNDYKNGKYSFDEFLKNAENHIKLIRNEEVIGNDFLTYDREIYQQYFEFLPQYKDRVKERLTRFLGYEPALEHSVFAEIQLRSALINDQYHFPETLTTTDMQAISVIKYREALLEHGRKVADESQLMALSIISRNSKDNSNNWADLF